MKVAVPMNPTTRLFTVPNFPCLAKIRCYYSTTTEGLETFLNIGRFPHEHPTYRVHDGLLYDSGRIVVPEVSDLRQRVITEHHVTPTAGHSGL